MNERTSKQAKDTTTNHVKAEEEEEAEKEVKVMTMKEAEVKAEEEAESERMNELTAEEEVKVMSERANATTPSTPKITNATFNNQQRQEVAMEQRGVGAKGAAMINEQTISKRTTMNEE